MIIFSYKSLSQLFAFTLGAIAGAIFPLVFIILDLKELELDINLENMFYVFNSQNIYVFSSLAFPLVFGLIATLFLMITQSHKALILAQERFLREQKKSIMNSKMASVGVMASGIAHEINNPITIINLSLKKVELALKKSADSALLKQVLPIIARINQTTERISKIIDTMKQLSHDAAIDKRVTTQVSAIVDEAVASLNERLKSQGIIIKSDIDDFTIECNQAEIARVLACLLANSIDEIVDKSFDQSKRYIKVSTYQKNGKKYISVTDDGPGISPQVVNNIFDPFFTTKDVSRATGLGLNTSKKIMRAYDGDLFCNDKSATTQFIMEFPIS